MAKLSQAKLKKAFRNKLDTGWKSYMSRINNRPEAYLIKHSREIAAVGACYDTLKKPLVGEGEMRYLMRFRDPLKAVMRVYLTMQEDIIPDDVYEAIDALQNGPDTDVQFTLDEEWVQQDEQELRRAFVRKVDRCWMTLQGTISGYTPRELLECAKKLEAARASYVVLKRETLPLECIRYLMRFKDPLMVTYEEWLSDSRSDPCECILEALHDTMDGSRPAENRYELEDILPGEQRETP